MQLPENYETRVGNRGLRLSGGEIQRIAIARAILRDCPIVIFDEATSALDTGTEREIQFALSQLCKGRTTFVIAHRLSTITGVDSIIVINGGKIVEMGTHRQLFKRKNGIYSALWAAQLGVEPN